MDTVFRRLFARKSKKRRLSSHRNRRVEGHAYDSFAAAKPPTKGSYPVGGNGPTPVIRPRPRPRQQPPRQDSGRPCIELVADAPSVPRRRHSDANLSRPQTAPQSYGWPHPRYSSIIAAPPTLRRRSHRQPSASDLSAAQRVRTTAALTSAEEPPDERQPYIDLLEAFWHLKPSRETYMGRTQASGRRDYGEDVADRNIADYGSLAINDGRGPALQWHGDGTGDDTTLATQYTTPDLGQIGTVSIYAPATHDANPRAVRTYADPASGPELDHGLRLRARPQSALADSRPFGIPSSRPTSMMSARTNAHSPDRIDILPLRSSEWVPPARIRSGLASRERSALRAGLAAISTTNGDFNGDRPVGSGSFSPTSPAAPPRLPGRGSPLTPPMSPTTNSSPTERGSLDKELPPLPAAHPLDQSPRRSTDQARKYSPNRVDGSPVTIIERESNSPTAQPRLKQPTGRVIEDSADGPEIRRAIGLTESVDTEVITHQKPAVVHEHITPTVHEIREEQITREIHHHDVLHRIQPIIDVEILPTKHYIPSPSGDGLVEVPASAVPGRHQNWEIKPIETNGRNSSETAVSVDVPRPRGNSTMTHDAQPIVSNRTKAMTSDGVLREETTWRHPPELESGGQRTGQTVPFDIYDDYDDDDDEYSDRRSSIGGHEEEPLFNDSEAFGGRLPGLDDRSPAIPGAFPPEQISPAPTRIEVFESEATRALKRRQAEVTRKMAAMSVEE